MAHVNVPRNRQTAKMQRRSCLADWLSELAVGGSPCSASSASTAASRGGGGGGHGSPGAATATAAAAANAAVASSEERLRLFPVGRLDKNTTGLLLVTNDGDLSYALCSPGATTKTYHAQTRCEPR